MPTYQYRVVPAPKRGLKARGVSSNEDRFAHALETLMNELGAQGWDYVRADTLPAEERQGLTGRTTIYQNMLVFRRLVEAAADTPRPSIAQLFAPTPTPAPAPVIRLVDGDATVVPVGPAGPRMAAE